MIRYTNKKDLKKYYFIDDVLKVKEGFNRSPRQCFNYDGITKECYCVKWVGDMDEYIRCLEYGV